MIIASHHPGRLLALRASRKDEALEIAYTVRAVLCWPLLPLWLVWMLVAAWRRSLHLGKPLRLRRLSWDARRGSLQARYGFWPLLFEGRKSVAFDRFRQLAFVLSAPGGDGQELLCRLGYGEAGAERTLECPIDLPAFSEPADAEDFVFHVANVVGWRRYRREQLDDGSVRIALSPKEESERKKKAAACSDDGAHRATVPSREQLAELRAARGGPAQRRARRKKLPADLPRALGRHARCRVLLHRAGRRVVLHRGWDGIAVVFLAILAIPLGLVPSAFVVVATLAFVVVPAVLLESVGVHVLGIAFTWYAGLSAAAGALAAVVEVVRSFVRDYGPRRIDVDWSERVLTLGSLLGREAVPFEDIAAVLPRAEWQEPPADRRAFYETRVGLDLVRWGSAVPLRLVWVGHTRKQSDEAAAAFSRLGQHLGRLLGVPCRQEAFTEIESGR